MENPFGKTSKLHLTAAKKDGRTILENVSFTAPFKVMHPFYEKKDVMTVMLLCASAGILAGDRQEFQIDVRPGAHMEFTSQSYEKIHRMKEGFAVRQTRIQVAENAELIYMPLPVIPYAGSDFRSHTEICLSGENARLIYREVLACGRAAHGESFDYKRFQNRVCIYQDAKLAYYDNTDYHPDETNMRDYGLYEGYTHLANMVLCNKEISKEWVSQARARIDAAESATGGVTKAAFGYTVVRVLGMSGQQLTGLMDALLEI